MSRFTLSSFLRPGSTSLLSSPFVVAASLAVSSAASAQWLTFTNQTATRMPTGAGLNDPATTTADPEEKDYAWGDVDQDGDIDLVIVRKIPFTFPGGKTNVLLMNENGVLIDRTIQYASEAINVPAAQGVSQGFRDLTNDRDIILVDINNDGWLDMVTATTISDGQPRYIGHPRVYINKGEVGGVWQGFVYDYNRIPQMLSKAGVIANPRFCSVGSGDINGDGYVDLYFGDYDGAQTGPGEDPNNDFDNKLLMNQGAANPGFFVDESTARMGSTFNYGSPVGTQNLLYTAFGAASIICDMTGDGNKDIVKQTSLQTPQHVAVKRNASNTGQTVGMFAAAGYKVIYNSSPYFVSAGDLNNDGRLDLVMTDDGNDRYLINTGNDANGNPNFTSHVFLLSTGGAESNFGSNSVIVDLDNDGWNEVLIADVDVDGFGCARRTFIYRNMANVAPGGAPTMQEQNPSPIPTTMLTGTHDVAVFDINGDGWKDIVIGRCNSTEVWMQTPKAAIAFSYPNGRPETVSSSGSTTIQVQLTGTGGGVVDPANARINVSSNGSAFVSTVMTHLGGGLFEATIGATPCPTGLRYYISGRLTTGTLFTDPAPNVGSLTPASYYSAYSAAASSVVMDEKFEGGAGAWSVVNDGSLTGGAWQVASPNGTWNEGVRAAPAQDFSTAGTQCFVTENGIAGGAVGANDVDGGPTHLISPVIDLAGANAKVSFAYWFYTSTPGDVLTVSVSNDNGSNWTTVATYAGPKLSEPNLLPAQVNSWKTASFTVGDFVTPTSQVRVRFSTTDVAPAGIVEAAIDDVQISKRTCGATCPGDTNSDQIVNVNDLLAVINGWGSCPTPPAPCPADVAPPGGDTLVNVNDLLAVINAWGPCK